MDVGSSFSIYGNLYGWYANQQLVNFIIVTGFWIIPYFFIFYQSVWGSRADGESYSPVSTLVKLEYHVYISLFVIALFLNPTVSISKLNFIYNNGTTTEDVESTSTSFADLARNAPSTVEIPPAWYGMIVFTNAFNGVLKTILPTGTTMRQLMHQLQQVKVDDPALQKQYADFQEHCLNPAQANYALVMSLPQSRLAQAINSDIADYNATNPDPSESWKINPHYAGNEIYQSYFYGGVAPCPQTDENGTGSMCMPLNSQALTPYMMEEGLSCGDWWATDGLTADDYVVGGYTIFSGSSLRRQIASELNSSMGVVDGAVGFIEFDNDKNLYAAMQRTESLKLASATGLNNKSGSFLQGVAEYFSAATATGGNVFSEFTTTIIRFVLPLLQGIIAMVVIIFLPILIVFSSYSVEKALSLAVTFFGLLLLPGVWHLITWLDQVVLQSIWGELSFLESTFNVGKAAWDLVMLSSYFLFTYLWFGLVSSMGGGLSRALASGFSGVGASAATAQAAGAGARAAWGQRGKAVGFAKSQHAGSNGVPHPYNRLK